MDYSPIVLFVYNRPQHTRKTIETLVENTLANKSKIYIYSDAPKNNNDIEKVNKVREFIKTIKGFKSTTIIERDKNLGLASNIIDGVTTIINKYGRVIVLEDDIVTSPYFLSFMNDALNFYENKKKVWHISGWNYPIDPDDVEETFLWKVMNCWGWATWADKWKLYEKNTNELLSLFNSDDIYRFNVEGTHNFWSQVLSNQSGEINTWAIYWYATIFKKNGLCLNPTQSYVENIGLDGSGSHCSKIDNNFRTLNKKESLPFNNSLYVNTAITDRIKLFFLLEREKMTFVQFSKKLNVIYHSLDNLKKTQEKFIIYGAGTGADLILGYMKNSIDFIVDKDKKKYNTYKYEVPIYSIDNLSESNLRIIISVLGRESEILNTLTTKLNIPQHKIITLNK